MSTEQRISRRDWWLGIAAVAIALLLHAALPRYDYRQVSGLAFVRIDRWTGGMVVGTLERGGTWTPAAQLTQR